MSRTSTTNTNPKRRKPRDFREEYRRRIENALAAGKSRSAARGHPTAADIATPPGPLDRSSPLEKALSRIKRGESQKAAAKAERVSVEKLRSHQKLNTTSVHQGRRWIVSDKRPVSVWLATGGKMKSVTVTADDASEVGRYWSQVNKFLDTNKIEHLADFSGNEVRDLEGRLHGFEVRPNVLRKLDSAGELDFLEIYADVAK
jgi:hypothetical protein